MALKTYNELVTDNAILRRRTAELEGSIQALREDILRKAENKTPNESGVYIVPIAAELVDALRALSTPAPQGNAPGVKAMPGLPDDVAILKAEGKPAVIVTGLAPQGKGESSTQCCSEAPHFGACFEGDRDGE